MVVPLNPGSSFRPPLLLLSISRSALTQTEGRPGVFAVNRFNKPQLCCIIKIELDEGSFAQNGTRYGFQDTAVVEMMMAMLTSSRCT